MNDVYTIADWNQWLEIQFSVGHRICSALKGAQIESLADFAREVFDNPKAKQQVQRLGDGVSAATRRLYNDDAAFGVSVIRSIHKHHQWGAYGFNVFNVSAGLCQRLLLTDPSSAPVVPMPYGSFLIHLTDDSLRKPNGEPVRGIWIHRHTSKNGSVSDLFEPGPIVLIEPMSIEPREKPICFQAPWDDLFKLNITVVEEDADYGRADFAFEDADVALTKRCAALAANLCFYLASAEGQRESTGLAQKTRYDQRPGFNWPRCWGLGKKLVVDPRLSSEGGTGEERTKLKFKHVVRGHWRNQACGEGMRDRKVIWIQPYWKGPDVEEAWTHAYEVK